jgi:hypothetical protein
LKGDFKDFIVGRGGFDLRDLYYGFMLGKGGPGLGFLFD